MSVMTPQLPTAAAAPLLCIDRIEETHDAATFVLRRPDARPLAYKAGQFIVVAVDVEDQRLHRAYSLSSTPTRPDNISITVKRVANGRVSNHLLDQLRPGHAVTALAPAGDFNIVRSRLDIKNWTPNHNKRAGVLDEEIAFLDTWVAQGWRDVTRELVGDVQGPYTWWSWRGKAFDNDAGWRIDHQFVTPQLAGDARSVRIGRADSYDARFSDHAPLSVDYAL